MRCKFGDSKLEWEQVSREQRDCSADSYFRVSWVVINTAQVVVVIRQSN